MLRRLLLALFLAALAHPQSPIRIRIEARATGVPVPATVFGTFLEPIGNSTYNGLWAELLQNPSLESGLWSESRTRELIVANPQLTRASQLALPLPWEPLHLEQENRYEPLRGDAANSFESLAVFGLPDRETGIRQEVYLPVFRELSYSGSLFLKHLSGSDLVRISIRKRNAPDQILATTELHASTGAWQKYSFELSLKQGQLQPLEPADFVVAVDGDERAVLDQINLFPADALEGLDADVVQMAKDMQTPLVRFGGNFTSSYHWPDGIGPQDKRISMRNVAWGIPETNQFGTDEFLHFCHLIAAQPQIALNLGTGTIQEAAGWVRYVNNHWSIHTGLLWELGNELWGTWNNAYPTLAELAGRTLQFSQAIKQVDPSARLIATGQDPDHYREWNATQLTNPAGTFDFLSTHFVVQTDRLAGTDHSPETIARDTFALPIALERKLHEMQKQIDTAGQPKTHIAFTEWLFHPSNNREAGDAPSFNNLGGAITASGFLNIVLRNAGIVPVSDMTGILEFAGIWKKRSQVYGTPSYYAFKMFSTAKPTAIVPVNNNSPVYNVQGGVTRLPDIPDVPYLDTVAVRTAAGITLFCVNRHLNQDLKAGIEIDGSVTDGNAAVQELFAQSPYEVNDEVHPFAVTPKQSSVAMTGSHVEFIFRRASLTRIDFKQK